MTCPTDGFSESAGLSARQGRSGVAEPGITWMNSRSCPDATASEIPGNAPLTGCTSHSLISGFENFDPHQLAGGSTREKHCSLIFQMYPHDFSTPGRTRPGPTMTGSRCSIHRCAGPRARWTPSSAPWPVVGAGAVWCHAVVEDHPDETSCTPPRGVNAVTTHVHHREGRGRTSSAEGGRVPS